MPKVLLPLAPSLGPTLALARLELALRSSILALLYPSEGGSRCSSNDDARVRLQPAGGASRYAVARVVHEALRSSTARERLHEPHSSPRTLPVAWQ